MLEVRTQHIQIMALDGFSLFFEDQDGGRYHSLLPVEHSKCKNQLALFSKKVHLSGSCLLGSNIVEIGLFDATSRKMDIFVFKYKLQVWEREGRRENKCVRLTRLSPATSEQPVPGAECHAMSSTKEHQFVLVYKCKAPLITNLGPISCSPSRIFMVDSGTTPEPVNMPFGWEAKTTKSPLSLQSWSRGANPFGQDYLLASCLSSAASPLLVLLQKLDITKHHKNNTFWLNKWFWTQAFLVPESKWFNAEQPRPQVSTLPPVIVSFSAMRAENYNSMEGSKQPVWKLKERSH